MLIVNRDSSRLLRKSNILTAFMSEINFALQLSYKILIRVLTNQYNK